MAKQNGKVDCYTTYLEYFKGYTRYPECKIHYVKWPKTKCPLELDENATFFVFESAVEQNIINRNLYLNCVKLLIEKYSTNHNYLKFHPHQNNRNKTAILNLFDNNQNVEVLPAEIPFELILSSTNKITVCGFTTSLLIFANKMGHFVHSGWKRLLESEKFRKYLEDCDFDFNTLEE